MNREMYVYKSVAESRIANVAFRAILLVAQSCAVFTGGRTPISACGPLCAIFLREPRVYSLSPAKTNVERFADDCAKTIFCRVIPIDRSRVGVFAATFEKPLKSV